MSRLVILRGNSGSGKTTVAKMLQEKFGPNTMLISHDMIRMQILHVWSAEGVRKSLPLMIALLRYGRRNSEITILEGILPYEDYKPLFEAALEEYGENIFSYYYDISFEETLRRHQTKPNRDEFGEADMRRWWREKDFLEVIPQTVLDEDVRLEEAVELIYGQVTA
ncbi:zeta toxin family protein [uncultured Acetatifactor sp.]|uniref:zeta toxin family protein n=1 Tax=uncultured Acetatifactor sp. TaxID=1671927 RepID=UPI002614BCA4|nr:zeta toxin family protein [uncultured Acetatifactor sp.]